MHWEGSKDQRQQPALPPEDRSRMKSQQGVSQRPRLPFSVTSGRCKSQQILFNSNLAAGHPGFPRSYQSDGTMPSLENHRIFIKEKNSLPTQKKL